MDQKRPTKKRPTMTKTTGDGFLWPQLNWDNKGKLCVIYWEGCNDQPKNDRPWKTDRPWKKQPTKKQLTITKMTNHNKNDRPWNATDFCHRYSTGSTRKMVRDYGGLCALLLYIGPHADVTGLVGKCKLFMDVANKTTSMICFGLTRMFFLSGANYSGQRPLYPWIAGT